MTFAPSHVAVTEWNAPSGTIADVAITAVLEFMKMTARIYAVPPETDVFMPRPADVLPVLSPMENNPLSKTFVILHRALIDSGPVYPDPIDELRVFHGEAVPAWLVEYCEPYLPYDFVRSAVYMLNGFLVTTSNPSRKTEAKSLLSSESFKRVCSG